MPGAEMKQDRPTVTPQGESIERLPAGVSSYEVPIQIDERGSLRELFDLRSPAHRQYKRARILTNDIHQREA
jgi:hypothetical protein